MAAVAVVGLGVAYAEEREMVTLPPQQMKFANVPGLPTCASAAVLRGDPAKGAAVLLAKMSGGCRVPWHWHSASEELMIVSGSGMLDMKEGKSLPLHPGAYSSLPGHHAHQARCSSACMFFVSTDGAFDIHYIDDKGAEISAEQALKPSTAHKKKK